MSSEDSNILDDFDYEILKLANKDDKFAIPFDFEVNRLRREFEPLVEAIERGIDNNWFFLIDISPLIWDPTRLYRIYRLTPEGKKRKLQLETARSGRD